LLAHVGCTVANPFYINDKDGVVVPEKVKDFIGTDWIVPTIKKVRDKGGDRWSRLRPMWFPLCMLKAAQSGVPPKGKNGVMIGLMGTRGSGKSTLATMAMSYRGWRGYPPHVTEQYFLYEPPSRDTENTGNTGEQILGWIQCVDQLRSKRIMRWVNPTRSDAVHMLRAVFPKFKASVDAKPDSTPNMIELLYGGLERLIKELVRMLAGDSHASHGEMVPTIAMYDSAGEWTLRPWWSGDFFNVMRDRMDVLAIVIDPTATDFPRNQILGEQAEGDNPAVRHATAAPAPDAAPLRETLNLLSGLAMHPESIRPVVCVLVTKVDEYYRGAAADFEGLSTRRKDVEPDDDGTRNRLLGMLRRGIPDNELPPEIEKLCEHIKNQNLVRRVFFIWTEGIPEKSNTSGKANPFSHNLGEFLAWSLEQDRNPAPPED